MRKPLPTSTATFRDIISGGFLYIDKTKHLYDLINEPKGAFFLSRPRRFGKSLFLSTLEELFRGNRDLFRGLWIANSDYDWPVHPVIRIDFSRHFIRNVDDLEMSIQTHLQRIGREYGVELSVRPSTFMFEDLIYQLSTERQVVILIDEYDKPLINHLDNLLVAREIQTALKGFYGVIKSMEYRVRLAFITGVSKFSRVSIFSELNNLTDLTMRPSFGTAFGITEDEMRSYFADYITEFAKKEGSSEEAFLAKVRHWYNGFCFAADSANVYNPFATMQLFDAWRFSNYWFESGTPTFLIKRLHQDNFDVRELDHLEVGELAFSTYDLERLAIVPLLFQTGYLTVKAYDAESRRYTLSYPNYEVENAFITYLLDAFSNQQQALSEANVWRLIDALRDNDLDQFFKILKIFFANIDYDLHLPNEKYYQTIFYLIFMLMGLKIQAETKTNDGRIDAVAEVKDHIYIFEFKLNKDAQQAVDQIVDKEYAQKYGGHGKPITQVGVSFDSSRGQVSEWKVVA